MPTQSKFVEKRKASEYGFPSLWEGQAERLSDVVGLGTAGKPASLRAEARTHFYQPHQKTAIRRYSLRTETKIYASAFG